MNNYSCIFYNFKDENMNNSEDIMNDNKNKKIKKNYQFVSKAFL